MEKVSTMCGVSLTADDGVAPISGYHVTAVFHEYPAHEVLGSLVSLYRVPPDFWYWVRRKRGDENAYILRCTLPPEAVLAAREEFGHQFRLSQKQRRAAFFAAAPEVRARMAQADPMLAAATPRSLGFFSFIAPLSDNDLREIARGREIDFPADHWTPEQRVFIREEFRLAKLLGRAGVQQPEELSKATLYYRNGTVVLGLGRVGGHGVLGGIWLRRAEREELLRQWIGDGEDQDFPDVPIPAAERLPAVKPEELLVQKETLDLILLRMARLGKLNLLFDSPPSVLSHTVTSIQGLNGRLPQVFAGIGAQDLIWKRRGGVLLIRRHDWPHARSERGALWPVIKELRTATDGNNGYLRPQDWLRLAGLEHSQLDSLGFEFPDALQIKTVQVLLRLFNAMSPRERDACGRADGAGWADWSNSTRQRLQVLYPVAVARRARILVQWESDGKLPRGRFFMGNPQKQLRVRTVTFQKRNDPNADGAELRRRPQAR